MLDEQSGLLTSNAGNGNYGDRPNHNTYRTGWKRSLNQEKNSGGASRFFYCAKTSKSERNARCEELPEKTWQEQGFRDNETSHLSPRAGAGRSSANSNHHPTVKPLKLMEYLIRLVTPKGGVVLDPFMGSGSTGLAAKNLGFEFIGIEKEAEYFEIAQKRIASVLL
jgi:site-specific DNA-methyltransferase (adenine-specific)